MKKSLEEERAYAIRSITEFLSGTGGERDWDTFTSISLRNKELDSIRTKAINVDLPVDNEGEAELLRLLLEIEAVRPE